MTIVAGPLLDKLLSLKFHPHQSYILVRACQVSVGAKCKAAPVYQVLG